MEPFWFSPYDFFQKYTGNYLSKNEYRIPDKFFFPLYEKKIRS